MRRTPSEGKVAFLIWKYRSSPEFAKLRPLTQRDYNRQLDKIGARYGKLGLSVFDLREISREFYGWRDLLAKTSPRQADYAMAVLKALNEWGVRRGYLHHNRAAGIENVYRADRSEKTWSDEQEEAFMAEASPSMALGFLMASEAGISPEDIYVMPKTAIRGTILVGRRQKTGVPFAVPISPTLRAAFSAAPASDSVTILNKADGRPFDPKGNGFRSVFRATREAAGVEDRTHKDCRGTFMTRRRAMGWTAEEVALCVGHPIAGEKGAQSAYIDRIAVAIANAERLWTRWYGSNEERDLQTAVQTADKKAAPKGG
ncbi:MAG: hypothetical protein DI624_04220 [Brevundimonas sp.]|nr:MAG: hypothetical protein DI624_04220 [Brevundimonas sp.]